MAHINDTIGSGQLKSIVRLIPQKQVFHSYDFTFTFGNVNISGSYKDDPEDLEIELILSGWPVQLTEHQNRVLSIFIYYTSYFEI